ncbi:type II CAAX endopeptidase family protein [Butyrivibrio sp. X503]|uniref:type II CAAX endopeptidase family protein n=1 Tax=Butyrivibrio sp. X503 TaxID=2364878 RepID=UPI001A9AF0F4|nr:type II CAAX endopeptidase family protein [Butyrivibrio sp. X503]
MENKAFNKKEFFAILAIFILVLVAGISGSLVLGVVAAFTGIIFPGIVTYLAFLIPALAIVIAFNRKEGSFLQSFGFKPISWKTVLLTVLLTVVSYPIVLFMDLLSQFFVPNIIASTADSLVGSSPVIFILQAALIAPICEETLMRGFFQNRLAKVCPFIVASIVSGFLFGAFHMNLNQFCYAWVLGIIFAYANRASGSIFTSIIMHVLVNAYGAITTVIMVAKYSAMGTTWGEIAEKERADSSSMMRSLIILGLLSIASVFLTKLVIKKIAEQSNKDAQAKEKAA